MLRIKRILQVTMVVAAISGFGFLAGPGAHSACGDEHEGTWDGGAETCSGSAANCTEITVCPPKK